MSVGAVGEEAGDPSYKPMSTTELKKKIIDAEKRKKTVSHIPNQPQKKSFWDKLKF